MESHLFYVVYVAVVAIQLNFGYITGIPENPGKRDC